jgi:sigma-B regulation protein RsbU (phosphoserine phosphatase)
MIDSLLKNPETDETQIQKGRFLQQYESKSAFSERIEKLVSSRWFVKSNAPILDVSEELKNQNISAAGVVDENSEILGIVIKQSLLNLLSRQYGREVLKTSEIKSVMSECRLFDQDTNIFAAAELISHEMKSEENIYYAVKDPEKKFTGIFSTNDMLVYLSMLTRRDIELAKIIQKGMVKEFEYVHKDSIEIVCSSIMAQSVGGDFYSIQKSNDDSLFLALCDVSGKGIAASLVTAFLSGMIYNYRYYSQLTDFVLELNRLFVKIFEMEKFVTGQFIDLDAKNGNLVVCEMGHPFAFSYKDENISKVFEDSGNLPVGISSEIDIQLVNYRMTKGEIIIIVTDGFTEQTDNTGTEFSIQQLSEIFKNHNELPLNSLAVRILEYFHSFRKKTPLRDDATFILIRNK